MLQVKLRTKHQLTLPISIVREANIAENDSMEASYRNGVITLVVQKTERKKASLMDYVGSTGGLYGKTAADVQAYIQNERASWER